MTFQKPLAVAAFILGCAARLVHAEAIQLSDEGCQYLIEFNGKKSSDCDALRRKEDPTQGDKSLADEANKAGPDRAKKMKDLANTPVDRTDRGKDSPGTPLKGVDPFPAIARKVEAIAPRVTKMTMQAWPDTKDVLEYYFTELPKRQSAADLMRNSPGLSRPGGQLHGAGAATDNLSARMQGGAAAGAFEGSVARGQLLDPRNISSGPGSLPQIGGRGREAPSGPIGPPSGAELPAELGKSDRIPTGGYGSLKVAPPPVPTPIKATGSDPPVKKPSWYTREYAENAAQEALDREADDRFKRMNHDLSALGKLTHTVSALDNRASSILWQERAKGDLLSPRAVGAMTAKGVLAVPSKFVSVAKLLTATEEGNLGGSHVTEAGLAVIPFPGSETLGPMFVRSGVGRTLFRGASIASSRLLPKESRVAAVTVVAKSGMEQGGKQLYNTLAHFVRGESG